MRFCIQLDLDSIKDLNLPQEMIDFLSIANAACPVNNIVETDSKSYIVNNILNFNNNASLESFKDYMQDFSDILENNEIPFARDGFGNLYLVKLDKKTKHDSKNIVRFYNHETSKKTDLMEFDEFVKRLL